MLVQYRQDNENKFHKSNIGWLSFEGTVFSLNETKSFSAAQLFSEYEANGDKVFSELDGTYIIKLYDRRTNQHKVINDFIKNKSNYFCETKDFFLFTPYLITSAILIKPMIDPDALNEFMWRYYILSFKTILKNVERLKPAHIFFITENLLSTQEYWQWPKAYSNLDFKNSVEKMVSSMQETARLITRKFGNSCIDFTMGQDSRQVISSFTNQNLPFTTATFGKSDFYEVAQVKDLAQRQNIKNYNVQLKSDFYENIWKVFKKAILIGNCEQPGYLLGRIIYLKEQYKNWANVSLNGVDGHFYKNGLWDEQYLLNLYRQPKQFNIPLFLKLRALSKKYPESIFSEEFNQIKARSPHYFRELINNCIKGYQSSPVSMQIDKFDLTHWLNFALAANSATNSVLPHLSPLLLRRNLEFALQVPVKWKFNLSQFQRAVVFALDQDFAKEKTDFGGVDMVPKNIATYPLFYFKYFYFQSERARKKIKSKLGLKVTTHLQEAWDYLSVYTALHQTGEMQSLLFNNRLFNPYLNKEEWKKINLKLKTKDGQSLAGFELTYKIASIEYFLKSANNLWDITCSN